MWTGADGALPLPWLAPALADAQAQRSHHAMLLHAAAGHGALELALALAQAGLCERPASASVAGAPCGRCDSCRLLPTRGHPDLLLLMPEAMRHERQWPIATDKPESADGSREGARKRASRQVRIDEIRLALDWVVSTSSRGQGKWLVIHPADALNNHAASALLKTLEEPPSGVQIILTAGDPAWLLPTIRSRCRSWRMAVPDRAVQRAWLTAAGVDDADVLLAAAGAEPLRARRMHEDGWRSSAWIELPRAISRGEPGWLGQCGIENALDALQRLCHDLMCRSCGGSASFFPEAALPRPGDLAPLAAWQAELMRWARNADHPWQEPLLVDSLVVAARQAMAESAASARSRTRGGSGPLATLSA